MKHLAVARLGHRVGHCIRNICLRLGLGSVPKIRKYSIPDAYEKDATQ